MVEVAIMAPLQGRRDWLEEIVGSEPSLHLAGTTITFPFLRSLIDDTVVDVGVIDLLSIPDSETSREWLRELLDMVSVVVLMSSTDSWTFSNIVRSEKGALLRPDAPAEQLICAIHSSANGLLTLDSSLIPQAEVANDSLEPLTVRENEVLRLLAEGLSNREIADRLNISEHTIKFHIRSILGKLGASTRTQAVTRGLRAGLIEL